MKWIIGLAVAAGMHLAAPALRAQETPPPLSAYGELPGFEQAVLSSSGKHIAAVATLQGQRRILIMDDALNVLRMIGAGQVKVRDLEWIGDDAVLMYSSQTARLNSDYLGSGNKSEILVGTVISVDKATPAQVIFGSSMDVQDMIYGAYGLRQTAEGWRGYFGGIEMEKGIKIGDRVVKYGAPSLYEVDLSRNVQNPIERPGPEGWNRNWLLDRDGEVRAIFNFSGSTGAWNLTSNSGSMLAQGSAPTGQVGLVGFGPAGESVIYSIFDETRGETVWLEVPLAGGQSKEFAPGVDVDRLYRDPYSDRVLGYFSEAGAQSALTFFDKTMDARANKIRAAFAKLHWRIASFTPDFAKAIVRTSGNDDSGTWYLVDTVQLKASAIGYEHVAVGAKVGPISTFAYQAGDGTPLDGILTLPRGKEAKGLPVVIFPHGGPHSEDRAEFDWWAQAMASRGYAVFQPNFRGSTNRDDAFRRAGYGEWGGKMQSDISDGLAALAAKGVVDPRRACIVGASFGGYAALAGVTLQQGVYRCAVAVAPVSDIETLYNEDTYRGNDSFGSRVGKDAFLEQIGARDTWAARSPLRHAERTDAPILLIHGKDDTVVPYSHSSRMQKALEKAGKPATLVTLKDEDHWLSRAGTRMEMLEATMTFLAQHNPVN